MFDQDMLHSLYLVNYLDRNLLAPIRTLYSTCHKLNEKFCLCASVSRYRCIRASASQLLG